MHSRKLTEFCCQISCAAITSITYIDKRCVSCIFPVCLHPLQNPRFNDLTPPSPLPPFCSRWWWKLARSTRQRRRGWRCPRWRSSPSASPTACLRGSRWDETPWSVSRNFNSEILPGSGSVLLLKKKTLGFLWFNLISYWFRLIGLLDCWFVLSRALPGEWCLDLITSRMFIRLAFWPRFTEWTARFRLIHKAVAKSDVRLKYWLSALAQFGCI